MTAQPPQDEAAEQAVLGAALQAVSALAKVRARLSIEDFYVPKNQVVYRAAVQVADDGHRVDHITVADELERRGELARVGTQLYLHTLIASSPTTVDIEHHIEIVAKKAAHRRAQEALGNAVRDLALPNLDADQLNEILARTGEVIASAAADTPYVKPARGLVLTPASAIRIRPVRWLWDTTPFGALPTSHGRIPMNSLALAAGGPGLGKSQFATWVTARITRGELPGELYGKPRGVIYAASEDSWSYTIAPRLLGAGANMDFVYRIDVTDDGHAHARLTLPTDTSLLGEVAEAHGIALVIADPLLSLIDKGINDYRAAEVRAALEPLVAAADKHCFTILGLAHFTKSGGSDPLTRVAGSGAFGQLIRCLIAFAQQDGEDGGAEYVMSLEKNNLGRLQLPGHQYTIQPVTVDTEEGPSYVSQFVLGPETTSSVRDVMREDNSPGASQETSETVSWLRDYLIDVGGSDRASEIKKLAAKEGFSFSSMDRAKRKLGIVSKHSGFAKDRVSHWYLPDAIPAEDAP
ncbi:DnaB-like helicase N-terminal domain-containing protein [Amycolatopsis sp.]|jgi:hypothetical protein|uniref:DnaB-like helicase N-terminal domain-containing protein n=1 Tax=Amycolatopsis sp. TaxID=37632 RepID=UPI002E0AAC52|nr:DnaB-like helicase N-terminal domain-containing protein [Amycolatopsis sp.]